LWLSGLATEGEVGPLQLEAGERGKTAVVMLPTIAFLIAFSNLNLVFRAPPVFVGTNGSPLSSVCAVIASVFSMIALAKYRGYRTAIRLNGVGALLGAVEFAMGGKQRLACISVGDHRDPQRSSMRCDCSPPFAIEAASLNSRAARPGVACAGCVCLSHRLRPEVRSLRLAASPRAER